MEEAAVSNIWEGRFCKTRGLTEHSGEEGERCKGQPKVSSLGDQERGDHLFVHVGLKGSIGNGSWQCIRESEIYLILWGWLCRNVPSVWRRQAG